LKTATYLALSLTAYLTILCSAVLVNYRRARAGKGAPTRKVWYYQLDPGRNMGKTNPLADTDLAEFIELQKTFADSPKSWSLDMADFDRSSYDLSVKNSNGPKDLTHRSPQEIMGEISALDAESAEVLASIRALI